MVSAELEHGASGLQVQHSNRAATLPPSKKSQEKERLSAASQLFF